VRVVRITDLKGLSLRHLAKDSLDLLKAIMTPVQRNFPEFIHRIILINVPSIFAASWPIIASFFDPRVKDKIEILGSDYTEHLLKYISPEQLPVEFGGKNLEPIHEDFEAEHDEQWVPARAWVKKEVEVEVGQRIQWDCRSIDKDIDFEIKFVSIEEHVSIVSKKRLVPKAVETGIFECMKSSGRLVVTFDNSYSYVTGKTIYHHLKVSSVK